MPDLDAPTVMARVVQPDKRPAPTVKSRVRAVGMLLVVVTVLVAIYLWNPAGEGNGFFPKCPTHFLTGFYCPGCGTLRAMHQLLHGHLLLAIDYNPITILLLPVLGYGVLVWFVRGISGRRLPCPTVSAKAAWAIFIVIVLFMILRNLPCYPLTLLAP